jgi:2-dehydropantoate 2-reductase
VRHAVVGAGGIGGLIAAVLARGGADVVLVMRPQTLAAYEGKVTVDSAVLGRFEVAIPGRPMLDEDIDFLWFATKATQLESALPLAPSDQVGAASVIPLLNGIDHVALLRTRYDSVVAGAIRVESERVKAGSVRQSSPFLRVELAGAAQAADDLRAGGVDCEIRDDELSLLWDKLAFLAPVALATTAMDGPLGAVRGDARFRGCQNEALAVARAEGAQVDDAAVELLAQRAPNDMRSSMQKDVEAGREPELDAIAGPILRGGVRHGISVLNTQVLADLVVGRRRLRG